MKFMKLGTKLDTFQTDENNVRYKYHMDRLSVQKMEGFQMHSGVGSEHQQIQYHNSIRPTQLRMCLSSVRFLMGWFGVVFKSNIQYMLSDQMAVRLTTGYLGSLTTFSGWNQKMLNLSSGGHWVFAIAGIIFGILLVNDSIRIGVESAEALRRSLVDMFNQESGRSQCSLEHWRVDTRWRKSSSCRNLHVAYRTIFSAGCLLVVLCDLM